jgi:hypothetical protein
MSVLPGLVTFMDRGAGSPAAASANGAFGDRDVVVTFARVAGWFGGLLLAACGLLVAGRRLAGAFAMLPGPWEFAILLGGGAAVLAMTSQACRIGTARAGFILACCGFAATLLAVGLPADRGSWMAAPTPLVACAAAAAALLAPACSGPAPLLRRPRPTPPAPAERRVRRPRSRRSPPPGRLSQRQQRYVLSSGAECIRGRIQLEVPAGARTVHGHLGFCPAFGTMPEVKVETPYDGVEATVTAAEIVPWGVRIECRLAEPAEEPIMIPVLVRATART